jgi:hypothetical protein
MAVGSITNAYVSVNGVDLSDHVVKITTEDSRDKLDITAMGATSKVYTKGLGDAKSRSRSCRTSPRRRCTRRCSR